MTIDTALLTDLQRAVLASAATAPGGHVNPLEGVAKSRQAKVASALVRQAYLIEVPATETSPIHREDAERGPLSLIITDAGLAAIGLEPLEHPTDQAGDGGAQSAGEGRDLDDQGCLRPGQQDRDRRRLC